MLHELARIIAKHILFLITMLLSIIIQPKLYRGIILQDAVELVEQLFFSKHRFVAVFNRHIGPLQQLLLERTREHWRGQNCCAAYLDKLISQPLNTFLQQTPRISHCIICKKCTLSAFTLPLLHNISGDSLIVLHDVLPDIIICGLNTA
ncbi:hypothetical protein D3C73_1237610 [compost metagenome]